MVVEEKTQFRLVGKRMRRADSPERLTGNLRYTGDLVLPGLLHGRLVRSPYASARIVSIDKTEALAMPGVVAVLAAVFTSAIESDCTRFDDNQNRSGMRMPSRRTSGCHDDIRHRNIGIFLCLDLDVKSVGRADVESFGGAASHRC